MVDSHLEDLRLLQLSGSLQECTVRFTTDTTHTTVDLYQAVHCKTLGRTKSTIRIVAFAVKAYIILAE